jgi:uncharacterized RDD family membrane protein YckC
MKCPKCGYQSFNFLSTCKKCGRDLTEVQQRFRLGNPILPQSCQTAATAPDPSPADDPSDSAWPEEETGGFTFSEPADGQEALVEPSEAAETSDSPPVGEPAEQKDVAWAEPTDEEELTMDFPDDMELQEDPFTEDWTEQETSDEEAFPSFDEAGYEPQTPLQEEEAPEQTGLDPAPPVTDETATRDADWEQEASLEEDMPPADEGEPLSEVAGDEAPEQASETDCDQEVSFAPDMPDENGLEQDLPLDEEADLDAWLLDGEEPSWRHKEPQAAETADFAGEETPDDEMRADNHAGTALMPDDAADPLPAGHDQVELPFPEQEQVDMPKPSPLARLLASLIDLGLLLGSFVLFVLAGEYLCGGGRLIWPQPAQLVDHAGPYFLVFFGLAFGYFTLFHYLTGQTPGKMAGKLVVTDQSGQPLQLSQAFLRSVGGLMCLLPAGLGFCSALLDREGRGWNDRLAGSRLTAATRTASSSDTDG